MSHPTRLAAAILHTVPEILAAAVYVPSSDRAPLKVARKRTFLESMLTVLGSLDSDDRARLLLGADLNVVSRDHQPPYPGFLPFEYDLLDELAALDLHDAHQSQRAEELAYSWFGRTGNGYRFDYIHLGAHLHTRLVSCECVQAPRELGADRPRRRPRQLEHRSTGWRSGRRE